MYFMINLLVLTAMSSVTLVPIDLFDYNNLASPNIRF